MRKQHQQLTAGAVVVVVLLGGLIYTIARSGGDEAASVADSDADRFDLVTGEDSTIPSAGDGPSPESEVAATTVGPTALQVDTNITVAASGPATSRTTIPSASTVTSGTTATTETTVPTSTIMSATTATVAPTTSVDGATPTSDTGPPSSQPAKFDIGYFDVEGGDPRSDDLMVFDALEEQVVTPSGNGWRHELKIEKDQRVALTAAYEDLQATITVQLSNGAKTIVAQHHASDTGTIAKLYISDTAESGFINSVPNDGIFDVYVRLARADGDGEEKRALGTVRSGDSFSFRMLNDRGVVTVSALGETFRLEVEDSSESYLKFGNYLQAQDPTTLDKVDDSDDWAEFYRAASITTAVVTFSDVNHVRQTD